MVIVVLKGGPSAEREVSLKSGAAVAAALRSLGHSVVEIDLRESRIPDWRPLLAADAVFIALHGTFGEDGTLQRMLEARRICFTGSRAEASALAMDKAAAKRRFLSLGLPTPDFGVVEAGDRSVAYAALTARVLGYPVVVKPNDQGSSVGVSIHQDGSTLAAGVRAALRFGSRVMLERFVAGREITVGILGGRALPAIELRPAREFFDYDAKYRDDRTQYAVDRNQEQACAIALRAHRGLGCTGISRVDLIVPAEGPPQLLEVNTIPGLTERSLVPKAARAAGIEFADLCAKLVKTTIAARRARSAGA
jgi:D-alanine-D-alanine ligase